MYKSHTHLSKANERYMDNWVRGVVGEPYHKIQIVLCSSLKITLNEQVNKISQDFLKWVEYRGLGPL